MTRCILILLVAALSARPTHRQVALTFDDLPNLTADEDSVATTETIIHGLIRDLSRAHAPAIGFVNESKVCDRDEDPVPRLVTLLDDWLASGLDLGNHTFSHEPLSSMSLAEYEADILNGEHITRPLAEKRGRTYEWFRHPYLDTGKTPEEGEALNQFLVQHGYRIAPVTIDDSEWIFALAYRRATNRFTRWRVGRAYLRYMQQRFEWYEAHSRMVFGREIPQILLMHADALNADMLPKLLAMIRGRGYSFVTLDEAMRDPSYESKDAWRSEAGVSWILRWGVARGMPESQFGGDPQTPEWVQTLAGAKEN